MGTIIDKNGKDDQRIRNIDLSSGKEIGHGQCASIIQISQRRVVKMFYDSFPKEKILKEYGQTCEAYRLGIHSVKCFGFVSCQGRTGIELEMVTGGNIQDAILKHPGHERVYGEMMAQELRLIHSKSPDPKLFYPVHEIYLKWTEQCCQDGWITSEEAQKITKLIHAVPVCDTMVHGDYHILNVMNHEGKVKLIDIADCMTGHPIYDLMISNLYLHYMAENDKEVFKILFKISPEESLSFWDQFVRVYFGTEDEKEIAVINQILDVYSMLKHILAPYSYETMDRSLFSTFVEKGRAGLMPYIDRYTGLIPANILDLGRQDSGRTISASSIGANG